MSPPRIVLLSLAFLLIFRQRYHSNSTFSHEPQECQTSPQAKCHKPSLLITSFTILISFFLLQLLSFISIKRFKQRFYHQITFNTKNVFTIMKNFFKDIFTIIKIFFKDVFTIIENFF